MTFGEWLGIITGPKYIQGLLTSDKFAKAAFLFREKELAEIQAREKALRDALEKLPSLNISEQPEWERSDSNAIIWYSFLNRYCKDTLLQPTDDTALKALLAKERERCADAVEDFIDQSRFLRAGQVIRALGD